MQTQFNRINQPPGRSNKRIPRPTQVRGVPSAGTYQSVTEPIEAHEPPTMALGPQKVNTRSGAKRLAEAERGTSG